MKKLSFMLAFCMLFGLISGCDSTPKELSGTEQYVLDCGATLTAGAGMKEVEMDGFSTTLQGRQVFVMLLEENKTILGTGGMTLEDYAQLIKNGNSYENEFFVDANGNLAIDYKRDADGIMYYFYATVHESESSFWLCQMACKEAYQDQYKEKFSEWSASLEVEDTEAKLPDIVDKTYILDCGVQFTGPNGMREIQKEGYDAFLTDNYIAVMFLSEEKPEGWGLKDYAEAVAAANELDDFVENEKGVLSVECTRDHSSGVDYWYYVTVFETEESFWLCQFFSVLNLKDRYEPYLAAWSASIKSAS